MKNVEIVRENSNLKNKKGITLIALVITIIILLILAGVSIATITGENGLLERARTAKEVNDNKSSEEKGILSQYEDEIDNYYTRGNANSVLEKYSETETVIGTWIDNKPLYRKVIVKETFENFKANLDNPEFIKIYAIGVDDVDQYFNVPFAALGGNYVVCHYAKSNDMVIVGGSFSPVKMYYIIDYTKTTD